MSHEALEELDSRSTHVVAGSYPARLGRSGRQREGLQFDHRALCVHTQVVTQQSPAHLMQFSFLVDPDRRLAQQTAILKERNSSLLKAAGSIGAGGSRSGPGGGE